MKTMMTVVAGLVLAMASVAGAQAPAGAPAGATGICKDGSYWTGTTKSGACRGHKGVQTWYADAAPATSAAKSAPAATKTTPAMPAPSAAAAPAARPAPTPAASAGSMPATTANSGGTKKGPAAAAAGKTAAAGGGPNLVWVNTESNVYHCYGDTYYGKTKAGAYMSEADAKAKGAHGDHGKVCSK